MVDTSEAADTAQMGADIEREKLAVERAKLDIEREKLSVERYKGRCTALAVAAPLVVLAIAVWVGVWQQFVKSRDDLTLRSAEIVMAGDDAYAWKQKGRALATLLPDRLGPAFAEHFEPERVDDIGKRIEARKQELLRLLVAHPDQRGAMLTAWRVLFPHDEWVAPLQHVLVERKGARKAASRTTWKAKAFGSQPSPPVENHRGSVPSGAEGGSTGFDLPLPSSQQEPPSSFVPR